jgi:hypothetical protein
VALSRSYLRRTVRRREWQSRRLLAEAKVRDFATPNAADFSISNL